MEVVVEAQSHFDKVSWYLVRWRFYRSFGFPERCLVPLPSMEHYRVFLRVLPLTGMCYDRGNMLERN